MPHPAKVLGIQVTSYAQKLTNTFWQKKKTLSSKAMVRNVTRHAGVT